MANIFKQTLEVMQQSLQENHDRYTEQSNAKRQQVIDEMTLIQDVLFCRGRGKPGIIPPDESMVDCIRQVDFQKITGLTPSNIRRAVQSGQLPSKWAGDGWQIEREVANNVARWLKENPGHEKIDWPHAIRG